MKGRQRLAVLLAVLCPGIPSVPGQESVAPVLEMQVQADRLHLTLRPGGPLAANEVFVLQSSANLQTWKPVQNLIAENNLAPAFSAGMGSAKEFFRAHKETLPAVRVTSSIVGQDSTGYVVRGTISVDRDDVRRFPTGSLEMGIVDFKRYVPTLQDFRFNFQSEGVRTRAEAEAWKAGIRSFVAARPLTGAEIQP